MPELQIGRDKVCFVIVEARELDVQEAPVSEGDEDSSAIDDDFRGVLETHGDDPAFQQLKDFIDDLNVDEQVDLVALTWVGRADFTIDEWDEVTRLARSRRTGPTSLYLLGIPLLSDYLEEGLAAFGLSCND